MAIKSLDRVVVKLSGSLFGLKLRGGELRPYLDLFSDLHSRNTQPIIVAGGGETARCYISLARRLGADEASLDEVGILATRLNARLLVSGLGPIVYPAVPASLEEVVKAVELRKVVVTGGLQPGQSTNATAALIAEATRARLFINTTDVEGLYVSDPRSAKGTKRLSRASVKEAFRILAEGSMLAGTYELMDLVSLKIVERSKIPTRIVKCSVEDIKRALEGREVGTLITAE